MSGGWRRRGAGRRAAASAWLSTLALGLAPVVAMAAAAAGPAARAPAADEPMEIRLRPERVTTLTFPPGSRLESQVLGADLVLVQADPERRQLHLTPRVPAGRTNLNVTVSGRVRVFRLEIGPEEPDLAVAVTAEERGDAEGEEVLGAVPVLAPDAIPVADVVRTLAALRADPAYAAALPGTVRRPVGRVWRWHGCPVVLQEVVQFSELDLLVVVVGWRNETGDVLTLPARRVELTVGGRVVPKTLWCQRSAELWPGQTDELLLFVQGWRLSRENDFGVVLPPEVRGGEGP